MAERVVFNLASTILSTVASPAFQKAYEKGLSIWEAREELAKLRVTIETIQAVLLDAEKKQQGSAAVKSWIKRLKGVLYDAEDLFDEVVTEDLLKQQIMKGEGKVFSKKVQVSSSKLNPIISRNSIAKKVKTIRKNLLEISADMAQFEFDRCQHEEPVSGMRKGQDPGCFVDAKAVIGRDEDKKALLEMLFNELSSVELDLPIVIAIIGIGGMGKTTLAQLVYNDDEVIKNFENRWFACISDISDEREVLGKILQSICEGSYSDCNVGQLQTKIRESVEGKKYLLVLDDVWEDHRGRWKNRMSLLSGGAKGSRIIVTTRLSSVQNAVGARAHNLEGLSEDDSWNLFKSLAFDEEYEKDPTRESLGREILKRCRGVPLAVWSIGSLLHEKDTIKEWEAIEREDRPMLGDETMSVLKLSYDHLPSNLKQCFAYCALFPKDYWFEKHELIYLWIAQGYVKPNNEESSFMHLLRRGFFQEAEKDAYGELQRCKMHDIMHDLALYVAGEESTMLISTSSNTSNYPRHVSVGDSGRGEAWAIPAPLLNAKRLRSFLSLEKVDSVCSPTTLDQLFTNCKLLRALRLKRLGIENIPPSIGELKLMRYLDLSHNDFEDLPDTMTNLVNLLALNLVGCRKLKVLPQNLHKLINLRYLNIDRCYKLKVMPVEVGKLDRLQYLSHLKVGKGSELDALAGLLQQLRGNLLIGVKAGIEEEDWNGDECKWQLPVSLHKLVILRYPGIRIPGWGNNVIERTNNLARLELLWCEKVRYLPPLWCLPNLRWLAIYSLSELEFVQEEDNGSIFFPRLEEVRFGNLPKLKGWWRKVAAVSPPPQFPLLSQLSIRYCGELDHLKPFPLCPQLRRLCLSTLTVIQQEGPSTVFCPSTSPHLEDISISNVQLQWLNQGESLASLRRLHIISSYRLTSLCLKTPQLQTVLIKDCNQLESFDLVEAPSLIEIEIVDCKRLKILQISSPLNALRELVIRHCPELWELHLDWDSLSNLGVLHVDRFPPLEKLPHCLRHRRALGLLQIIIRNIDSGFRL